MKILATRVGEDALSPGLEVTLRFEDARAPRSLRISATRRHKSLQLASFDGAENASDAEPLVGASVEVSRSAIELAENEYFDDDLIGCTVLQEGRPIGTVARILHYPAQDVLQLEGGALVPLVRAFVRDVDPAARIVRVELPPGLVEGEPETG